VQATLSDILRQLGMYLLVIITHTRTQDCWNTRERYCLLILLTWPLFVIGTHFGVDLMHRKAEVKDIITDVINNMSDEEEEADDDGGEDTDKEEDKDEDA